MIGFLGAAQTDCHSPIKVGTEKAYIKSKNFKNSYFKLPCTYAQDRGYHSTKPVKLPEKPPISRKPTHRVRTPAIYIFIKLRSGAKCLDFSNVELIFHNIISCKKCLCNLYVLH